MKSPKRKQVKQSQKSDFEEYKSIFENLTDIYYRADINGKLIKVSPSCLDVFGYSSIDEVIGGSLEILYQNPNERSEFVNQLKKTGKVKNYRTSLLKKDGSEVYIETTASILLDGDGNYAGVEGIARDITERKRANEFLLESQKENQAIINASPDTIFRIKRDGSILSYHSPNNFSFHFSTKEIIGKNLRDIMPPHISKPCLESIENAFQSQEIVTFEYELPINGKLHYFEDRIIALTKDESLSFIRDITKRKHAQEELNKSEEKYRRLINNTKDVIWTQDLNFQTTYMSNSVESALGYTVDEYLALPVKERLPAESMEIALKVLNENLQKIKSGEADVTTHTFSFEMLHRHKNGELIWGEVNCSFLHDDKKNITGLHGITRDITHRKQTENALRESEDRYRRLVEQSPFSIAIYQDGKFVYVNPAGVSILGATNEQEIIGKPVLSIIHPDSHADVIKRMELVTKGIPVPSLEEKLVRLDGSAFDGEVVAITTTFNNRPAGQVIVRNITEYKRAERAIKESQEKLKQLFKNSFDTIVLLDSNGTQIFVSESAERTTGFKPEEVTNIPVIEELIHPDDREKTLEAFKNIIVNGSGTVQYRHKHKNGGWVDLEAVGSNQLNNPSINAVVVNVRDITERKKAEQILQENETRLKELNETKDKLFSVIAHDLRAPFNGILGFSELLHKNIRNVKVEDAERWLTQINSTAKHTLNLLDNLLEWAKTQTGKIDVKTENIELLPIIQEIVNILDSSAKIKSISLTIIQPEEVVVLADPNMLKTILRNLISNAIKFTDIGGMVDIIATPFNDQVEISIKDSGIGMNEETKNNLFRLNGNTKKMGTANEKGSGLGLIVSKEFIEKQGGKITIESEIGKGSEFTFSLPRSFQ